MSQQSDRWIKEMAEKEGWSPLIVYDVPERSGDIVFKCDENPYVSKLYTEKSETGKFIIFDSTMPHCVTKNLSNQKRIIISMNFTYDE